MLYFLLYVGLCYRSYNRAFFSKEEGKRIGKGLKETLQRVTVKGVSSQVLNELK